MVILEDSLHSLTVEEVRKYHSGNGQLFKDLSAPLNVESAYWGIIRLTAGTTIADWLLQFEPSEQSLPGWGRGNGKVDVYGYISGS